MSLERGDWKCKKIIATHESGPDQNSDLGRPRSEFSPGLDQFRTGLAKIRILIWAGLLSQRQILGTGNLPQDSAPVCIIIDISPEMAAQSAQRNQAFRVTASDWSPIITNMKALR